jgi:hypothetical protein
MCERGCVKRSCSQTSTSSLLPKACESGVESCPLLGSRQTSPRYDAHNSRLLDQRQEVKHVEEGGT